MADYYLTRAKCFRHAMRIASVWEENKTKLYMGTAMRESSKLAVTYAKENALSEANASTGG